MVYGIWFECLEVWLDAMELKWSKLLVANVKPLYMRLSHCVRLFPSISSLRICTPWNSTLIKPFLTLYDVWVYFCFTFTPGVVVWAASSLPCTCVVDGFPGRYRRSQRIQQCTTGVSADNNYSIVMKHLFRDIVVMSRVQGSSKDKHSTISECHRCFYQFREVRNRSQRVFRSHFKWSAYLRISEVKINKYVGVVEMNNNMHLFVPILYSTYWILCVKAVACHHQGTS
jgi:hypothetical protein